MRTVSRLAGGATGVVGALLLLPVALTAPVGPAPVGILPSSVTTKTATVLRFAEPAPPSTTVSTPTFAIPAGASWKAQFSIRCAGTGSTTKTFDAAAYRGRTRLFAIRPPTALDLSYLEHVAGYSGAIHLQVRTSCPWSVVVTDTPSATKTAG